jgi:hypothetical protein
MIQKTTGCRIEYGMTTSVVAPTDYQIGAAQPLTLFNVGRSMFNVRCSACAI